MNKSMSVLAAALLAVFTVPSLADPTVFGLQLGKTTEKDFRDIYESKKIGVSKFNGGTVYEIKQGELDYEGIYQPFVIFDRKGILHHFQAKLESDLFKDLREILDEKYTVESTDPPRDHIDINVRFPDKYVRYRDGKTTIVLVDPIIGLVRLIYSRDEFQSLMKAKQDEEIEKKRSEDKLKF